MSTKNNADEDDVVKDVLFEEKTSHEIMCDTMDDMYEKVSTMMNTLKDVYISIKALKKEYPLAMKSAKKNKHMTAALNSGFSKEVNVSKELCDFLRLPLDMKLSRMDATRLLIKYIKIHELQDKDNGRIINLNPPLQKLLGAADNEMVTYFNIQKYLKHHFLKAA